MTLNLTIINPWGIWQSSDLRLVDVGSGRLVDDASVKQVILRCPDGAALLAYAGVGRIRSIDISDWIREMLRGETRTLDQSFILIRENATRDLAQFLRLRGIYHMFSIGAFLSGRPWVIQIRNFAPKPGTNLLADPPLDHFDTVAKEITNSGQAFVFGDPRAVSFGEFSRLATLATRKPRRPSDFRNLLASMNRRAAMTQSGRRSISPSCITCYMPPAGEPVESESHERTGAAKRLIVPILLFGIDLTEMQQTVSRGMPGDQTSSSSASLQRDTERAGRESVIPRNRLRL